MASSQTITSRLAPTPSGYLHMGNLYNFALTWLHTRMGNGRLLLRIDDLDQTRVRDQYIDDIFHTLEWMGLEYEEGPSGTGDFKTQYSQTLRIDQYRETVHLIRNNAETFYCLCSRKELERLSPDRFYQGTCRYRKLTFDNGQTALRLVTDEQSMISISEENEEAQQQNIHQLMPFPVLVKKDNVPSYQVASLTDDLNMKVNLLVRGKDLWTSSLAQAYLARIIQLDPFEKVNFLHHDLISGNDHLKLSKSQHAPSYRKTHASKKYLFSMVARSMNIMEQPESLENLLEAVKNSR